MYPKITFFSSDDGSYTIGIQLDWNQAVFYYPAIAIITTDEIRIYPMVKTYDDIDARLKLGLFKPPAGQQQLNLFNHNMKYYHPSVKVKSLITGVPNVPALEEMAHELTEMENKGIAYKPEAGITL